jgi:DNA uptake protein ComE-like DNA-binding protein
MVISVLAAMVAASLLFRMRAEVAAAAAGDKGEQAYVAAMSGVQRAISILQTSAADSDLWYDNPTLFMNQFVCDDGVNRWYFTIYADNPSDRSTVRYGLEDEASKININTANAEALLALPNMTPELVDCLLDYRDTDNNTRPQGAEQDYYSTLPQPYLIKNGPFLTLEELLLVKGFNAQIVYGEDYNMNGLLDQNEDDGDTSFPPDNSDGQLDTGLRGVATTLSYELSTDSSGKRRVLLNGDVQGLQSAGLPKQTVDFITAYLAEGNRFRHPSELLNMRYQLKNPPRPTQGPGRGGSGQSGSDQGRRGRGGSGDSGSGQSGPGSGGFTGVTPAGPQQEVWIESGVTVRELPLVMDKLTTSPAFAAGLVNVNTAELKVLSGLPGMGEGAGQRIIDARSQLADPALKSTTAWLFTEGVVDEATFKQVAPRLTARSYQFRLRCIGFGVPCGRFRILEVVVDMARGAPRIVYIREITRLGQPFALNVEQEQVR